MILTGTQAFFAQIENPSLELLTTVLDRAKEAANKTSTGRAARTRTESFNSENLARKLLSGELVDRGVEGVANSYRGFAESSGLVAFSSNEDGTGFITIIAGRPYAPRVPHGGVVNCLLNSSSKVSRQELSENPMNFLRACLRNIIAPLVNKNG